MKLNEKDRLIALAHLHQGKTPKEVEVILPNVSYAQALRLSKELREATTKNALLELFSLEEIALDNLLKAIREELSEAVEGISGDLLPLEEAMDNLKGNIKGMAILEQEVSSAAIAVVKNIKSMATVTNNPDTLNALADSLAKIQTAFFKSNNIQIANLNNPQGFERFLDD